MFRGFKAELFKAIAHPMRLRILDALRDGELSVGQLQTLLGVEQSPVSQHLAALRSQGLVLTRRDGTSVRYRIADPDIWRLLDIARDIYERHLQRNQDLLDASP